MRALCVSLAVLALPLPAQSQTADRPERLLPADCLFYVRYDGYEPHRKAYDKTALATAMKEGLGEFLEHVWKKLSSLAGEDSPIGGESADEFLRYVTKHGFVIGGQLIPPRGDQDAANPLRLVIAFPEGAGKENRLVLDKYLRTIAKATEAAVEEPKAEGARRGTTSFKFVGGEVAWWPAGNHMVLGIGERPHEALLRVTQGKDANITAASWFKELVAFDAYETDIRGRFDVRRLVELLAAWDLGPSSLSNIPDRLARKVVLNHLGLSGLNDLTFHLGFDGKYQRSTIRLGVTERDRRPGLLALFSGEVPFAVDKLPVMPPDTDYVSVMHVDWARVHDFARRTYAMWTVAEFLSSGSPLPDPDLFLGPDFRKGFVEQLDTTLVTFGGHSEGPFFFGQGFAVKVKDPAQVRKTLDTFLATLANGHDHLKAKKRVYRGHDLHVFDAFYLPVTFTLHKDWLVVGAAPQPVMGFLMRSEGKYRTWKAPPELLEVVAKEARKNKRKPRVVTMSDPRPAVEMGLAVLPTWSSYMKSWMGADLVDVDAVPNAQSINEWLFPNVTVAYDDNDALRWEQHFSMAAPDDFVLPLAAVALGYFFADALIPRARPPAAPPVPAAPVLPAPAPVAPAPVKAAAAAGGENDEAAKTPRSCKGTATTKDGKVMVQLTTSVPVTYTVIKKVKVVAPKIVEKNGVQTRVWETMYRDVPESQTKLVTQTRTMVVDGTARRVTRKDGKPIDPSELPRLLAKDTKLYLVQRDTFDEKLVGHLDANAIILWDGTAKQK